MITNEGLKGILDTFPTNFRDVDAIRNEIHPKLIEWGHPTYHQNGIFNPEPNYEFLIMDDLQNEPIGHWIYNFDTKELTKL
jgi:hypothetical protein